ncbi:hypothetical protein G647_09921 [Cladophialophora carrionii CBS 160.54]|uniref:Uncharacterized protein n=1 Tax=Cladophialophora carrionii CBS 160.54 TaxID=1279043 RepID=V9DLM3_9EURO|nr:uncharacterized protein G647_09921 [Cladophialophora carrionii CBS 160.54]ETI27238.1 hypothetical protein G647_09921 [Cladophialophora carrionii CBS 160.54]
MGNPEQQQEETGPIGTAPLQTRDQRSSAPGRAGRGTDERGERLTSIGALEDACNPPPFRRPRAVLRPPPAAIRSGNPRPVSSALRGEEALRKMGTDNLGNAEGSPSINNTERASSSANVLPPELEGDDEPTLFAEPWFVQDGARSSRQGTKQNAQPGSTEDTTQAKKRSAQPDSIEDNRQAKKQELEAAEILQGMKYSAPTKYARKG